MTLISRSFLSTVLTLELGRIELMMTETEVLVGEAELVSELLMAEVAISEEVLL